MTSLWNVLFVGYGYCAHHLYHTLQTKHRLSHCFATTRNPVQHPPAKPHFTTISIAHDAPIARHVLDSITHIVITAPPAQGVDYFLSHHQHDLTMMPGLRWLGYLSTTSVYGNHYGAWVTETSLCKPSHTSGRDRLKIEDHYMRLFYNEGVPTHIFRLSGIYGPHRSAFDQLLKPDCVRIDDAHKLFSRMHVSDIALSLYHSMAQPTAGEYFNLADYEPAPSRALMEYACALTHTPLPPLVSLDDARISQRMKEFYTDNKKVDGTKIRNMLSFDISFPNYRVGLHDIFQNQNQPQPLYD